MSVAAALVFLLGVAYYLRFVRPYQGVEGADRRFARAHGHDEGQWALLMKYMRNHEAKRYSEFRVDEALRLINDPDPGIWQGGIMMVRRWPDPKPPQLIDRLAELLKSSPNEEIRATCLYTLSRAEPRRWPEWKRIAERDSSEKVRKEMADAEARVYAR